MLNKLFIFDVIGYVIVYLNKTFLRFTWTGLIILYSDKAW
jgi:hypothetical protein